MGWWTHYTHHYTLITLGSWQCYLKTNEREGENVTTTTKTKLVLSVFTTARTWRKIQEWNKFRTSLYPPHPPCPPNPLPHAATPPLVQLKVEGKTSYISSSLHLTTYSNLDAREVVKLPGRACVCVCVCGRVGMTARGPDGDAQVGVTNISPHDARPWPRAGPAMICMAVMWWASTPRLASPQPGESRGGGGGGVSHEGASRRGLRGSGDGDGAGDG